MTNIFLSRPTWVDDRFKGGLDGFLRTLSGLELQPRTIGTTDYPSRSPLDEVISLMDVCSGAIVLGYPQLAVTSGTLKGKPLAAGLDLATEWNHIEASLAYSRRLPLLLLHHQGVSRGIFDRGAASGFLYEVDFADPSWPLQEQIVGAIRNWKNNLAAQRPNNAGV